MKISYDEVAFHPTVYNDSCVEVDTEGSLQSARVVVPIVLNLVDPKSVIDFGCGRGAWLKAFQENGVQVVQGLDGPWVSQSKLPIQVPAQLQGKF